MRPPDKLKNHDVEHPDHYTQNDIECIDAIEASMTLQEFKAYLKGNCIKYLWRYEKKENPKKDLQKARWCLNRLIENTSHSFNLIVEDDDEV